MTLQMLIVDDNFHFLTSARRLFEQDGMLVVGVASTADEALQRYEELRPDVTLVDIDLGEESGFDLARRLQEQAAESQPRVILMSAYPGQDFADLIADSPALGFLPKARLSGRTVLGLLAGTGDSSPGP